MIGFVFLSGCSDKEDLKLIIANEEIKVFSDVSEKQKSTFTIEPGELCAVGNMIQQKVFAIRKVLCENGKSGYIIARADDSYKLVTSK
jgi:hypothetical protein